MQTPELYHMLLVLDEQELDNSAEAWDLENELEKRKDLYEVL